jgi:hypothetical protein
VILLAVVLDTPHERISKTRGRNEASVLRHFLPYMFTLTSSCSPINSRTRTS